MNETSKRRMGNFLALIGAVVSILLAPSTAIAGQASEFRLPSGVAKALTVGAEGDAYVGVELLGGFTGEALRGFRIYAVEPDGGIRAMDAPADTGRLSVAGMAAAGPGSVWVPTGSGVSRVGPAGIEERVEMPRPVEIADVAADHSEGVWVADEEAGVFHVGASGSRQRVSLGLRHRGRYTTFKRVVADESGDIWVALDRHERTTEVIERKPDGSLSHFRIPGRFTYPDAIGVGSGRVVLQSGKSFREIDTQTSRVRTIRTPGPHCQVLEDAQIWCKGPGRFYRAFPAAPPLEATLPQPSLSSPEFAVGAGGQLWYSVDASSSCPPRPASCTEMRGPAVGQLTE
jgi:hypothetical protein